MKKKVFFVLSSLNAGGSERVFWLLAKNFDKSKYDVTIILLNGAQTFFSLENINSVNLNTIKASKSFLKLLKTFRKEKPDAVFVTGTHINVLVALIGFFVKIPRLIARESNIPNEMGRYGGIKGQLTHRLIHTLYKRFKVIVCQSKEMKFSLVYNYGLDPQNLIVIPNPIIPTTIIKHKGSSGCYYLIIVARLSSEKGYDRLLEIFRKLPPEFKLTIVGDGPLRSSIEQKVLSSKLGDRVFFIGQSKAVLPLIAKNDVFVLTSYTEGFPNVVIEALSVGVPVVAFEVGGLNEIIKHGFNGYIVKQGDIQSFIACTIRAVTQTWDVLAIKKDTEERFSIKTVVEKYSSFVQ